MRGWWALPALAAAAPAAASDRDAQIWNTVTVVAPVSDRVEAQLDLSVRLFEDVTHVGQILVRPMITYRIGPSVSVAGGYVYSRGDTSTGRPTHEHRALQQALFRLLRTEAGAELSTRTRLEQRFREGKGDVALRFRQQLRGQVPLGRARAYAAYEVFVEANGPEWGPKRGVEQLRATGGVVLPITDRVSADVGYMNMRQFRRGENQLNRIALVSLTARL